MKAAFCLIIFQAWKNHSLKYLVSSLFPLHFLPILFPLPPLHLPPSLLPLPLPLNCPPSSPSPLPYSLFLLLFLHQKINSCAWFSILHRWTCWIISKLCGGLSSWITGKMANRLIHLLYNCILAYTVHHVKGMRQAIHRLNIDTIRAKTVSFYSLHHPASCIFPAHSRHWKYFW